jgi:hypothetical protein
MAGGLRESFCACEEARFSYIVTKLMSIPAV